MGPPRLRLFGVIHIDRVSKVTAELDEFAEGVDALFIEQPEVDMTPRMLGQCLLRAPAFFFGWALYLLALTPLLAILHRAMAEAEKIAVRRVADRHDLPIHAIDDHPMVAMSRAGPRWWLGNWAAIALVAVIDVAALGVTAVALVVGVTALVAIHRWNRIGWLVAAIPLSGGLLASFWFVDSMSPLVALVSVVAFLATAVTTLGHRNDHMLERVGELAEREGYDETCLITGRAHLTGLVDAAPDSEVVVTRVTSPKWLRRSDSEWTVTRGGDDEGTESGAAPSTAGTASRATSATIGNRLLAAVVDLVVLGVLLVIAVPLLAVVGQLTLGSGGFGTGALLGLFGVPLGYFPLAEWRYGQTVGKRLVGVTVCQEDGTPCTLWAATIRHVFRPFEVLLVGLGFVSMVRSSRSQRLGDRVAGTVVVNAEGNETDAATAKDLSADRPTSQP